MTAAREIRQAIRAVRAARTHIGYARNLGTISEGEAEALLERLQALHREELALAQLLSSVRRLDEARAKQRKHRRRAA